MPGDLDDADEQLLGQAALEFQGHPIGQILVRVLRHLRVLTNQVRDLKARVDRLDPP